MSAPRRAVVTGGGGFLGSAIVERLAARGDQVTSVSRSVHPRHAELGVASAQVDLGAPDAAERLARVFEGADVVFHCAARAGVWGPREGYLRANVDGTQAVVDACRRTGVPRLVHTSSPSACFDGRDHRDAGNDLPLATSFQAPYPESKARAERVVQGARDASLAVCVLRPHLIFGPGDPHILPRLVDRARRRRLAIVGEGTNEVSLTFVENGAAAHIAAADALEPGAAHDGQAYFLGQKQHVRLWDWIGRVLGDLGLPPVTRRLSLRSATRIGAVCEALWRALPLKGEPPMTRFVAAQLATDHSYDLTPAERDFGYVEEVDLDEATRRSVEWLRTR